MYIAAGFGVEFPVIGFPELDTTYESTGFTRMTLLMVAALLVGVALAEINKEVSMKNFMYYHWALSAALITWQTGGTATSIGKMMFAMPHGFTLWSTVMNFGGKSNTD
jgi:hypothetical protein